MPSIRLGGFSNVKKDGTSHAGKLVHPILKMFNEDSTQAVLVSISSFQSTL